MSENPIKLLNLLPTGELSGADSVRVYDSARDQEYRVSLTTLATVVGGGGGGGTGTVETIVAGTNITVDATDPANPVVSAAGGADGTDGTVTRSDTGAPSDAVGVDGDFYIDEASGLLYKRIAGVYEVVASLTGPAGPAGADGALGNLIASTGAPNDVTDGVDGDYYINMTNGDFWGPKTAGDWGASATGSLAGADGADGADGTDGADGADGANGTSGLGTKLTGTITSNDLAVDMAGASCVTVYTSFNANINTVTITNYPATGNMARVLLRLVCDGTQRTIAFTVNGQTVFWDGGTEPTTPSTSGHVMWIALVTGTAWSASNVEGFLMGGAMQ